MNLAEFVTQGFWPYPDLLARILRSMTDEELSWRAGQVVEPLHTIGGPVTHHMASLAAAHYHVVQPGPGYPGI